MATYAATTRSDEGISIRPARLTGLLGARCPGARASWRVLFCGGSGASTRRRGRQQAEVSVAAGESQPRPLPVARRRSPRRLRHRHQRARRPYRLEAVRLDCRRPVRPAHRGLGGGRVVLPAPCRPAACARPNDRARATLRMTLRQRDPAPTAAPRAPSRPCSAGGPSAPHRRIRARSWDGPGAWRRPWRRTRQPRTLRRSRPPSGPRSSSTR